VNPGFAKGEVDHGKHAMQAHNGDLGVETEWDLGQRIINIWNSLPSPVVKSSPVNSFKNNF